MWVCWKMVHRTVRCTRPYNSKPATLRNSRACSAIIHRTIRWASGATASSRQRSTAKALATVNSARQSQSNKVRGHRTVLVALLNLWLPDGFGLTCIIFDVTILACYVQPYRLLPLVLCIRKFGSMIDERWPPTCLVYPQVWVDDWWTLTEKVLPLHKLLSCNKKNLATF
jgi:hypothetical protein